MPIAVQTIVARHMGDRKEQQDRAGIFAHPRMPGALLAVLADGMGGHTGGAMAAEQVVIKAKENFESHSLVGEPVPALLEEIINEAHLVIKLTRFTSEKDPHSTAVVLLLKSGQADWAHCGDSRLYHFRDGAMVQRTADHSLVEQLLRCGKIDEAEAETHPQRNVLLSCLGSAYEPRIAHGQQSSLKAGDAFLICSDGLWGYFKPEELGRVIAALPPRQAADSLIKEARKRANGHGDNITVIIIKLVDPAAG